MTEEQVDIAINTWLAIPDSKSPYAIIDEPSFVGGRARRLRFVLRWEDKKFDCVFVRDACLRWLNKNFEQVLFNGTKVIGLKNHGGPFGYQLYEVWSVDNNDETLRLLYAVRACNDYIKRNKP
jgi:hypothetical protein